MISVIILTRNEAADLPACLAALRWCEDVHVVDSGSTDDTVARARQSGAHVHEHPFESFARQRNWALDHCGARHEWVLFLDADEVATPEFAAAVREAVSTAPADCAGHYCCWKLMWQGRWLRHADSFPRWQFRLVRRGRARFVDFGHGQKEDILEGQPSYVRAPYEHHVLSKGLQEWIARHNRYAGQEAAARLREKWVKADLVSAHSSQRNKALKLVLTRLPGWPLLRFLWSYFLWLGFLEGRAGLTYCVLMAWYEFLIKAQMKELEAGK